MNLSPARIGLLLPPFSTLWAGQVVSYSSTTFVLRVSTLAGDLADVNAGLCIFNANGEMARIRDVNAGTGDLTLAENAATWTVGVGVKIYRARFPLPRYQRIDSSGVLYKDYDIEFSDLDATPANRKYRMFPPSVVVSPAVAWGTVGTALLFDASASRMVAYTAYPNDTVDFTWSLEGLSGTLTPSGTHNEYVSFTPSDSGFGYIVATATDYFGTVTYRYLPIWVDGTPNELTAAALRYRQSEGWTLDVEIKATTAPTYTSFSPVLLVDLETREALFHGWLWPASLTYDFEQQTIGFSAAGPLAFMRYIYAYPFILTRVTGEPTGWQEGYHLTLERALYYLLHWHSTLPELANFTLGTIPSAGRAINGQEFTSGTLLDQLKALGQAAFWDFWSDAQGSVSGDVSVLYRTDFGSITPLTLTAEQYAGEIEIEQPTPEISEARFGGVYRTSGGAFTPVIVRSPSHPGDYGRPAELQGLAPISEAELLVWAQRHIGLANLTQRYRLRALVDIDPKIDKIIELPTGAKFATEMLFLRHDPRRLFWSLEVEGRTYGADSSAITVPLPPAIVIPEVPLPDPEPPFPPIPEMWPQEAWAFTQAGGAYHTTMLGGPDDGQPVWTARNVGLSSTALRWAAYDRLGNNLYVVAPDVDGYEEVYWWNGYYWTKVLTKSEIISLTGYLDGWTWHIRGLATDPTTADAVAISIVWTGHHHTYVIRSADAGDSWTAHKVINASQWYVHEMGPVWISGSVISVLGRDGITTTYWYVSTDGGTNFYRSTAISGYGQEMAQGQVDPENIYHGWLGAPNTLGGAGYPHLWGATFSGTDFTFTVTTAGDEDHFGPTFAEGCFALYVAAGGLRQKVLRVINYGTPPSYKSYLYVTDDSWVTKTQPASNLGLNINQIYGLEDFMDNAMLLGRYGVLPAGTTETLLMTADDGVTLVGKSGSDPSGGVDSIPVSAGGLCHGGIAVIG